MHDDDRILQRIVHHALAGMLILLSLTACNRAAPRPSAAQLELGKKIFNGQENIKAKIDGHRENLSPQLAKCANCHTATRRQAGSERFAPVLDRPWLVQARVRRGGPAFAYDQASFCKTLREGMDPEYVLLNRAMPRFDLSNDQCHALWAFLMEKQANEKH